MRGERATLCCTQSAVIRAQVLAVRRTVAEACAEVAERPARSGGRFGEQLRGHVDSVHATRRAGHEPATVDGRTDQCSISRRPSCRAERRAARSEHAAFVLRQRRDGRRFAADGFARQAPSSLSARDVRPPFDRRMARASSASASSRCRGGSISTRGYLCRRVEVVRHDRAIEDAESSRFGAKLCDKRDPARNEPAAEPRPARARRARRARATRCAFEQRQKKCSVADLVAVSAHRTHGDRWHRLCNRLPAVVGRAGGGLMRWEGSADGQRRRPGRPAAESSVAGGRLVPGGIGAARLIRGGVGCRGVVVSSNLRDTTRRRTG